MKNTAVIGIGNILLSDDGVGINVIRELEKEELPSGVELVDGGTSTLEMIGYFLDYSNVIIIDALKAGYPPATIFKIRPEEIKRYKSENLSIHDVQILDVVKMANLLGKYPHVVIFGIEPKIIDYGLEISEELKAVIQEVIRQIKKELTAC